MAVIWLLLIASGVLSQGFHVPQQYFYDVPNGDSGAQLTRVPLAHAPQNSVAICRLVSSSGHQGIESHARKICSDVNRCNGRIFRITPEVSGDIVLRQTNAEDPVEITGSISGLAPGYHGFHIHQNANLSDNCKAAGSHFNPENQLHGAPQDRVRHAGDLGNIPVDGNGVSTFQILDSQISLFANHPREVLGRSIVVHQKEDDLGRGNDEESKKTGNAGARVACCVIEPVPRQHIL